MILNTLNFTILVTGQHKPQDSDGAADRPRAEEREPPVRVPHAAGRLRRRGRPADQHTPVSSPSYTPQKIALKNLCKSTEHSML